MNENKDIHILSITKIVLHKWYRNYHDMNRTSELVCHNALCSLGKIVSSYFYISARSFHTIPLGKKIANYKCTITKDIFSPSIVIAYTSV